MRNQGTCPRCGVRIELGFGPAPATGACAACGQRYFVVVPEAEKAETDEPTSAGAVCDVELLALREPPRAPSLRAARGFSRSAFTSMLVLAFLPLFVVLVALAAVAVPEAGILERVAVAVFLILGALLVVFPLAGLLALGFVRRLLARPGAPAGSTWHSVQVVGLGGVGLGASCLLVSMSTRLPIGGVLQVVGLLCAILLGACTVRLAPAQPYRHVLVASALFLVLGALLMLPMGFLVMVVAPLGLALFVPLFLLGAWLGVRFAPGPPRAELAP